MNFPISPAMSGWIKFDGSAGLWPVFTAFPDANNVDADIHLT
jgi:hypothetical protein